MAPQEFYTEVNDDSVATPWTVNNNHDNDSYFNNVLTKNHLLYGTGIPIGIKVNVGNPYSYDDGSELSAPMDFKYPYWINTSNDKGVVTTHWYVENGYVEVIDDRYVIKHDGGGVYKNFLNGCRFERMIIDFNNDFVDASGYSTVVYNEDRGKSSTIREFIHMCNRFGNNPDFPSSYNYVWNYYYAKREPYRVRDTMIALNGGPNQLYSELWNNDHTVADQNRFDCTKWVPGSLKLSPTILMYNCITANSFCDWFKITQFNGNLTTTFNSSNYSFTGTYPKLYYEKVFDKRKFSLLCEPSWKGPSIQNTASSGNYSTYATYPSYEPSIDMGPYFFINDNWNPDKIGGGGIGPKNLIDENELDKLNYNIRLKNFNDVLFDIVSNSTFFVIKEYNTYDLELYNKILNRIPVTNQDIINASYYKSNNFVDDLFDNIGYNTSTKSNNQSKYHYGFIKSFSWHPNDNTDINRNSIVFEDPYVC